MTFDILDIARDLGGKRGFLARLGVSACLLVVPLCLPAQVAVTGRVTSGDQVVSGATVSIRELGISSRTSAEGRYRFLIRAAQVRGQTVTIVARHSRYGSQSVQLVLGGRAIEQDFELTPEVREAEREQSGSIGVRDAVTSRTVDSTTLMESSGPQTLAGALAGRIPALVVTTGTSAVSSSPMVFRGHRTIIGPVAPLVVIDGVAIDNSEAGSALQRFGLGGFDYGTALQDIALDDIATVTLLSGASATTAFGSRAANGVLQVTTKQPADAPGLRFGFSQRFSWESPALLPAYQDRYGQGLGGQFEFFDGRGGGINDAIDQSWGPALDGQPIAQASLTEPGRPDVRYWLPHPSGVRDYFETGTTLDASIMVEGARQSSRGRAAANVRDVRGLTPNSSSRRLGLTLSGAVRPANRLSGRASLRVIGATADNRPGTGLSEINPVAGFTRLGRQLDLGAFRTAVETGSEQVNWIYTGQNNPYFQPLKNRNDDNRRHILGSGVLSYDVGRGLSAALHAGIDDVRDNRNVDVADGWSGGYPTALGRRDFSGGGSERQALTGGETTIGASLSSTPRRAYGLALEGSTGVERRTNRFTSNIAVTDTGVAIRKDTSTASVSSFYVRGSAARGTVLSVDVGTRVERSSEFPKALGFAVFPSLSVTHDAAGTFAPLKRRFGVARIRASWWRAGSELTSRTLQGAYAGAGTADSPTVGIPDSAGILPERTTGIELLGELASVSNRLAFELAMYRERSHDVMIGSPIFAGSTAEISNRGVEGQFRAVPFNGILGADALTWAVSASVARNHNRVEQLSASLEEIALGPTLEGATLVARAGQSLGVILGTRFLRDPATDALLLRNGLPIPDSSGLYILGHTQPDWTASFGNRIRFGAFELSVLFDSRWGGKVFSATNLWGSYAGTLRSTLEGRETGVTVPGIDSVTRAVNQLSVSAEDYFHSLGAIQEAWVYDATSWRLRDARATYTVPLRFAPGLREYSLRASLVGRNVVGWAKAPNIDPETALSSGVFQGFEMGQLPGARTLGLHLTISH